MKWLIDLAIDFHMRMPTKSWRACNDTSKKKKKIHYMVINMLIQCPLWSCQLHVVSSNRLKLVRNRIYCGLKDDAAQLYQTAWNVLYNSLIIRLGKFGPLDYSHLSPLQIRILSNNMSFITTLNLTRYQHSYIAPPSLYLSLIIYMYINNSFDSLTKIKYRQYI